MTFKLNNLLKNLSIKREVFYLITILNIGYLNSYAQANLKFKETKKHFGFVKKGETVTLQYEFTNSGNQPLIITDAKVECSCTTVDYPKQPIPPNATNTVTVMFNTTSVYDRQDRTVEILSNSKNASQKIRFKGIVLKK